MRLCERGEYQAEDNKCIKCDIGKFTLHRNETKCRECSSQKLILGAKAMAAVRGKYSPDIEDVQAVAIPILSHRIVKNYKAEAENISVAEIIKSLL